MTVQNIKPRMVKGLRDNKPPVMFGDIWLDVHHAWADSQADFEACRFLSNMDFTSRPGYARLAEDPVGYDIDQTSGASLFDLRDTVLYAHTWYFLAQQVKISPGRKLPSLTVKAKNTGGSSAKLYLWLIYSSSAGWSDIPEITNSKGSNPGTFTQSKFAKVISVAAGFDGEKTITFDPAIDLPDGYYWLIGTSNGDSCSLYYNASSAYADGALYQFSNKTHDLATYTTSQQTQETVLAGDMYFKMVLSGYEASGSMNLRLTLDEMPVENGIFRMKYDLPAGTSKTLTVKGSATGLFAGEEVTIPDCDDGTVLAPYKYFDVTIDSYANADRSQTPLYDIIEALYPKTRLKVRENTALFHVDDSILRNFSAIMQPVNFNYSDINVLDRVATGGQADLVLEDPLPDTIQRILSSYALKNSIVTLYAGCDVPGLVESDMLPFFTGLIDDARYIPRCRRGTYRLNLSLKNAVLALDTKIPQPDGTGVLDYETISVDHDGLHIMDSMTDLMRGFAGLPARYVDLSSHNSAKEAIGPLFIIRRSSAAGLTDTRIKTPGSLRDRLKEQCWIADGYITEDEGSRITFVRHDRTAAAEEVWADEKIVRNDGVNAIPIEDVASIAMGYSSLLFNATVMGAGWNGTGSEWTDMTNVYANVNSTSAGIWAPGQERFISILEDVLKKACQWLDTDENGYNGDTIAQILAERYTERFAYPPVIMRGVVTPMSQFVRNKGAVVSIWSEEFAKFQRKGIALSEILKFMILSKKVDRQRNRMVFDLLELT